MKRLLKIGTSRPEVTASALRASAATPASGVIFIDNSCGASAATAELSAALDSAFEQIDLGGDLDGQLRSLVQQLDQKVAPYYNSTVDENECEEWVCPKATAHTVSAAWKCALAAYNAVPSFHSSAHCTFEHDYIGSPSVGGTTKAFLSTTVTPVEANEFLPALVIAVCGSSSKVDHMVNANSQPRSARKFVGLAVDAHSGFLNSAEALDTPVSDIVRRYVQANESNAHIIFTGHSAGGAVASLLFLRHVLNPDTGPTAKLSCITFGAPPAIMQPLSPADFPPQQPLGLCLNIINEFDIVTRADAPYILGLVNILRSVYGKPALLDETNNAAEAAGGFNPSRAEGKPSDNTGHPAGKRVWPVPPLQYHHVGARVVLLMRLDRSQLRLKAVEVPGERFGQLLFCRVAVHRRAYYDDRMRELEGWDT